jgi:hypothetical protein
MMGLAARFLTDYLYKKRLTHTNTSRGNGYKLSTTSPPIDETGIPLLPNEMPDEYDKLISDVPEGLGSKLDSESNSSHEVSEY